MIALKESPTIDQFQSQIRPWLAQCDRLLFHRGPDSGGAYINENVVLAARRLRIHDLSENADQPFELTDHGVTLVWNGAIFNFRHLRRELEKQGCHFKTDCDSEVLGVGYSHWGDSVFERLDGMFALAILDRNRNRFILARDKLGIKPLFIYRSEKFWAFSSEIKPLLAHPNISKKVNFEAVSEQMAFQFIMPPRTLFKGIDVFLPGHLAIVDFGTGTTQTRPYWQMSADLVSRVGTEDIEDAFETSLKRCWDSDRSVGVQLSGGVDSSLICLLSQDRLKMNHFQTFSVLFDDSTARFYLPRSEETYIQRISRQCGLQNFSYTFDAEKVRPALAEAIWFNEQPLHGASTVLYGLLAREIKKHVSVIITGEGADDIFLGYFENWNFNLSPEGLFKFFIEKPTLMNLFGDKGFDSAISQRWDLINCPRLDGFTLRQKASVATMETVLHSLLARHDRMFMSNSIEGRPPFCTDKMINARFAMNDELVHNGKTGKLSFKQMLKAYTDHDFAFRKKIGFSAPFGDWCSDPTWWNGYVQAINSDLIAEFANVDALRHHQALPDGREKWSHQNLNLIFSLAQFQLWYDIFFETTDLTNPATWQSRVPEI